MSRHPFTHSCDLIRHYGPVGPQGVVLSRADASQIRQGIALALGMTDEELAIKLSLYFQANQERLSDEAVPRQLQALNIEPQHL